MINLSVLYRNTQKFFDHVMQRYGIGWGQILFLFFINENEGCTMQEVTDISKVDKGTTTKAIQKLQDEMYIEVKQDGHDKRVRRLYTTSKAVSIMNDLYAFRNMYRNQVFGDLKDTTFEEILNILSDRSCHLTSDKTRTLRIGRFDKYSLQIVPGKACAVIYLSGCNLKCPYCYEKELVFVPETIKYVPEEDVLTYLSQRKDVIDRVVISGGEPCLQDGLLPFLEQIHHLGYPIQLHTNGCYPNVLKECIEKKIVDDIVLDYKSSHKKMKFIIGNQTDAVKESLQLLKDSKIDYEVVTTLLRELHPLNEVESIAKELQGVANYTIRNYQDRDTVISKIYHALKEEELQKRLEVIRKYIPNAKIRR